MGVRHRNVGLRTFFVQYLLVLFVGFGGIVLIGICLLSFALKTGFVLSVSDVEAQIESQKSEIASAESVDVGMIPKTCKFAVISSEGEYLYGNMGKPETDTAWKTIQSGRRTSGGFSLTDWDADCYFPIERRDEVCIVEYSALSQFSQKFLREHLPAPEIGLFWTILAAFLAEILLLSKFYGKKISRKLIPLRDATEKIQRKDLAFDIQYSGIREIDSVLQSLDSMKAELKRSLQTQWNMEQMRKTQISALAHDLKTPLTVIRGNAEMLDDTQQTQEQNECTRYILKNAEQMQQYIQMLIDLSKMESGYPLKMETVDTKQFLHDFYAQLSSLAAMKRICVETEEEHLPNTLYLDAALMSRALINIAANAVEYSPEHGKIQCSVSEKDGMVRFTITDSGKGFSSQDLENATKQFYQGDSSRNSKFHYGMGLFIADSIVKRHGGTLTIANSPITGGGMVTMEGSLKK